MNKLEQYLRDNRPDMPAEGQFMIELNARMSKVDGVKKCVDEGRRHGRMAIAVALAAGFVLGGIAAIVAIFHPFDIPDLETLFLDWTGTSVSKGMGLILPVLALSAIAVGIYFMYRKRESF